MPCYRLNELQRDPQLADRLQLQLSETVARVVTELCFDDPDRQARIRSAYANVVHALVSRCDAINALVPGYVALEELTGADGARFVYIKLLTAATGTNQYVRVGSRRFQLVAADICMALMPAEARQRVWPLTARVPASHDGAFGYAQVAEHLAHGAQRMARVDVGAQEVDGIARRAANPRHGALVLVLGCMPAYHALVRLLLASADQSPRDLLLYPAPSVLVAERLCVSRRASAALTACALRNALRNPTILPTSMPRLGAVPREDEPISSEPECERPPDAVNLPVFV